MSFFRCLATRKTEVLNVMFTLDLLVDYPINFIARKKAFVYLASANFSLRAHRQLSIQGNFVRRLAVEKCHTVSKATYTVNFESQLAN